MSVCVCVLFSFLATGQYTRSLQEKTRLTYGEYCLGVYFVGAIQALKMNDKNFQSFVLVVVFQRLLETVMILDQMSRHRHNKRTFKMKSFSFFSLETKMKIMEFDRKLSFESKTHRKRERERGEREHSVRIHTYTHTHSSTSLPMCVCVCG